MNSSGVLEEGHKTPLTPAHSRRHSHLDWTATCRGGSVQANAAFDHSVGSHPCHLPNVSEESCHPPAKTLARFPPDLDVMPSMRHVKRPARHESLSIEIEAL